MGVFERGVRVGVCAAYVLVNDQRENPSSSPPIKSVSQSVTDSMDTGTLAQLS